MRMPELSDLIQDLQTAKQIAIEDRNPNAIVIATVSQAKLLGIDKPLTTVAATAQAPIFNIMGVATKVERHIIDTVPDYSMLSDAELRQLQAITEKMEKVTAYD